MSYPAYIAVNRFGMGAKPGEIKHVSRNPVAWLELQLTTPPHMPKSLRGMNNSQELAKEYFQLKKNKNQAKKEDNKRKTKKNQQAIRQNFLREIHARTTAAITTEYPLQERLARFWANHFTVSATKNTVRPLAGAFEREAIRPYILGRFEDMLIRVTSHPAMLLYLDNAQSIGPNSRIGQRRNKGLNENLAREIMELHTLGVDGGYAQADVIQFARVLTGWTVIPPRNKKGKAGEFTFNGRMHEPGNHQIMGRKYTEQGVNQGLSVLKDLARHPSTARHIATKLARHFISDNPPEKSITILTQEFLKTGGHLGMVTKKLITLPEVWQPQPGNIKTSEEFIISALRGLNIKPDSPKKIAASLYQMGQRTFEAPSPAGWSHEDQYWAGPDMILKRIEWAQAVASRISLTTSPLDMAENFLGQNLSQQTRTSIMRADSAWQAITLLLASPEFQRR